MANEHLSVKAGFTPQLHGVELVPPTVPKLVSWSEGTNAQIVSLINAHYEGKIDLQEHWKVGDTRTVHLSAMAAKYGKETHVEQDVEFQIVNIGGKQFADGTECAFIVQLKDVLTNSSGNNEGGYMLSLSSNSSGWKGCARRNWCNEVFRGSLPEELRGVFKLHKNKTSVGNQSSNLSETEDYFALPCSYNIFGESTQTWSGGADEDSVHWTYYDSQEKRVKHPRDNSNACSWWLRSPKRDDTKSFCRVFELGNLDYAGASSYLGFAPFGCI